MAKIIKRLSRGDAEQNAVLLRGDAVEPKFYHVVTKFYHYMTLKMPARRGCQRERKNNAN
jgi:hypothetical protein